jgi:hypothetical protein
MKNIATKIEGNMLWLGIDLTQKQGRTKGDKGTVIAATEGFRQVPDAPRMNMTFMLYERDAKGAAK